MPFFRRRFYRRSSYRRPSSFPKRRYTRTYRRYPRRYAKRPIRKAALNNHHFKIPFAPNWSNQTGGSSTGSANIVDYHTNLSAITNYGEFQAMFDQYRVNKIVFKFTPVDPVAFQTPHVTTNLPVGRGYLFYCINHTGTSYGSESAMLQCSNYKRVPYGKTVNICFTPCTLTEKYRSAIATGYSAKYKDWIDMADITCPQYGLTVGVMTTDSGFVPSYAVSGTMYFSCKSNK